jgi:hypothetical protein
MRTRTRVATGVATGVVVAALLASPALAATGQAGTITPGPGNGRGQQNAQPASDCDGTGAGRATRTGQNGQGGARQGRGNGTGMGTGAHADLTSVASGTLTDAQKTTLAAMAEEEKLAHDLYSAFADTYSTRVFTRIANAETQHLSEIRVVLDRYDITDPTAGRAPGVFTSERFQQLYDAQLATGAAGLDAAYTAATMVEKTDVADLNSATTGVTAPDVLQVYTNLLAGSERHIAAFGV